MRRKSWESPTLDERMGAQSDAGLVVSEFSEDAIGEGPVSSVPYSSDEGEVRNGVRAVVELQQAAILRTLGRLLAFVVTPIVLAFVGFDWWFAQLSHGLLGECVFLCVALVGTQRGELPLHLRTRVTAFGLVGFAVAAFFQLGPLMSTGLIFFAAMLGAALLLPAVEVYLAGTVLVATLAIPFLSQIGAFGRPVPFSGPQLEDESWVRLLIASAVSTLGVLHVFLRVQKSLWNSFESEISLRVRERRLVAEREKVLRRAASSQRLESLGRLAGGVAHDFNNALVVIQCGLENLGDEVAPEERREILLDCRDAVERAGTTAKQLLSFAKRNVEDIGISHPREVLERLGKEVRRLFPAHVQLALDLQEVPAVAISDAALEQLVLNLLQNARDALAAGGGTVQLRLHGDPSSGGLLLEVRDDGPGMSPDVAEHAFEPFFTTRGDQGAGLGLSTVWGIVQRHGGEVMLETDVGVGTSVSIQLPAAKKEDEARDSDRASSRFSVTMPTHSGIARRRVLVLEDEAPVRAAIRRILVHLGFEVVEAATVAQARAAAKEHRFDLLLSDGVIPDGGVGAFIHEFRVRQRGAPVILCSGYLEEDLVLEGIARGEAEYLAKPFSARELAALVERIVPEALSARLAPSSSPTH